MTSGTLIRAAESSNAGVPARRGGYRCECGHVLRVFGGGRHRVFFEPDAAISDPLMNGVCSQCGRGLPGKNGR